MDELGSDRDALDEQFIQPSTTEADCSCTPFISSVSEILRLRGGVGGFNTAAAAALTSFRRSRSSSCSRRASSSATSFSAFSSDDLCLNIIRFARSCRTLSNAFS